MSVQPLHRQEEQKKKVLEEALENVKEKKKALKETVEKAKEEAKKQTEVVSGGLSPKPKMV